MSATRKQASTLRELKQLQLELSTQGERADALRIGHKVRQHELRVACRVLGVPELPGTLNGVLIKEIAVSAALHSNPVERYRISFLLKRLIGKEGEETTNKLVKAKASFPNLKEVEDALLQR